jgi:hypothetical protein
MFNMLAAWSHPILGAEIGFLSILHSWGSNVLIQPHVHFVVPGGGFSPDHQRWIHTHPRFLPIPVLRRVFRDKFLFALKRLCSRFKLFGPYSFHSSTEVAAPISSRAKACIAWILS